MPDADQQSSRVLILDGGPLEAELMVVELIRRSGFEPAWQSIENEPEHLVALHPGMM
jgi:hypothetical protein